MNKTLTALILSMFFLSCTNMAKIDNSLKKHFESEGVDGTFAMLNNQRGDVTVYNLELDTARMSPGSLFKIAEALIGLETSRLTDESTRMKATDTAVAGITLKKAFDQNHTEYFRLLATEIGADTMKHWLETMNYGNMKVGDLHNFWLNKELKISPDEQLGLMFKLYFDKLPVTKYAQQIVRDLMLKEDNTLYTLSYATGVATANDGATSGMLAGWIEENRHVYFFTTVVKMQDDTKDPEETAIRITKKILEEKGFFKGEM